MASSRIITEAEYQSMRAAIAYSKAACERLFYSRTVMDELLDALAIPQSKCIEDRVAELCRRYMHIYRVYNYASKNIKAILKIVPNDMLHRAIENAERVLR